MFEPVCVVTTAWNQVDKTLACLKTIEKQDYKPLTILLVNNGSTDATVDLVSTRFPQVEIISLQENLGPTRGYNLGFRRALDMGFSLIFLVNNDTLLAQNCISELVNEAQTSPNIGLLMPKIYYAEDPKRIWSIGGWENFWNLETIHPGKNLIDTGQWKSSIDIDDAPFCAVLVKDVLLKKVGLPDENFILYYEDRDFSRRAQKAGFRLRMVPSAQIWHAVSTSSGGSDSPRERYWMARSSVLFFLKNNDIPARWPIIIFWRTASAIRTTIRLLKKRKFESIRAYWLGLWHGIIGKV